MGKELPIPAIRSQIASGIDIIVQLGRIRDKSRKVLEIAEVDGMEAGDIRLRTLYKYEIDKNNKGKLVVMNQLIHKEKLIAAGLEV